jgi:hypothetical protein
MINERGQPTAHGAFVYFVECREIGVRGPAEALDGAERGDVTVEQLSAWGKGFATQNLDGDDGVEAGLRVDGLRDGW